MSKGRNPKLPMRKLRDEDWKWAKWIKPLPSKDNVRVPDKRPLLSFLYYEYARESSVLRRWAEIEALQGDEPLPSRVETSGIKGGTFSKYDELAHPEHYAINEEIQRGPVVWLHSFLWSLRAELANDTPWLCIESARKAAVISAEPSFFTPWPDDLRLAFEVEIEGARLLTEERSLRTKRKGCEVIALRIDWEGSTNAELAESLAYLRPKNVPEPKPSSSKRGKGQAHKLRAYLRALAELRLCHHFGRDEAFSKAGDFLGNRRPDVFDADLKLAVKIFRNYLGWIDGAGPMSRHHCPTQS